MWTDDRSLLAYTDLISPWAQRKRCSQKLLAPALLEVFNMSPGVWEDNGG